MDRLGRELGAAVLIWDKKQWTSITVRYNGSICPQVSGINIIDMKWEYLHVLDRSVYYLVYLFEDNEQEGSRIIRQILYLSQRSFIYSAAENPVTVLSWNHMITAQLFPVTNTTTSTSSSNG